MAIRSPGSFLAVFTNEKNFRHRVIGSPRLNRLGLHVLRILLSDACHVLRTLPFFWLHPVLWWRYMRDGFVIVDNVLAPADFEAVQRECAALSERYWQDNPLERTGERGFGARRQRSGGFDRFDGDSANRFIDFPAGGPIDRAYCRSWKVHTLAWSLLGRVNRASRHSVYELVHGGEDLNPDSQRVLHRDTFHHTYKTWFYLDDVEAAHGPTEVVAGSHRSSLRRLRWEYRQSLPAPDGTKPAGGAFRIGVDELAALGLPQPRQLTCRANSLVIVNTKGFHRRGVAPRDTVRRSIYANFRPQAFLPLLH
jgi:ectoine hydroxylase-related dioxygenase (phytanoyl-CoA dioxygenase family)